MLATTLPELVAGMNRLAGDRCIDLADLKRQIDARDREIDNPFTKDPQVMAIRNARRSRGDRLTRTAAPHKILDPKAGPLIAVRLNILTRKTLGGLQTDLSGRVLEPRRGQPVPGLYAAGEVAGFGGGGHARLPLAGGHLPRRLPVQRPPGRPGRSPLSFPEACPDSPRNRPLREADRNRQRPEGRRNRRGPGAR